MSCIISKVLVKLPLLELVYCAEITVDYWKFHLHFVTAPFKYLLFAAVKVLLAEISDAVTIFAIYSLPSSAISLCPFSLNFAICF